MSIKTSPKTKTQNTSAPCEPANNGCSPRLNIKAGGTPAVIDITVKNRYKLHAALFAFLSFHLIVFTPVWFINKTPAAAVCICVLMHIGSVRFKFDRPFEAILFFSVNLYLTFAFFGYSLLFEKTLYKNLFVNLLTLGMCFIWTGYVLQSFLDLISRAGAFKESARVPSAGGYRLKWLLLFTIMLEVFLLWQQAYNPVIMSNDSWEYIAGWRFGEYDSFRSPVYAFIINIICSLAPTKPEVQWIAVVQITAFSALLATWLMYLHKIRIAYKYTVAAAVVLPLIPSLGLHTIVIWCDLACGMSMLWLAYVTVRII
ncbi:MAG: hypothetical protein FWG32_06080, partial [Oscillospiraceae bacterium]|nr:hypothetical protein [Oscillospiraceae bacterium]